MKTRKQPSSQDRSHQKSPPKCSLVDCLSPIPQECLRFFSIEGIIKVPKVELGALGVIKTGNTILKAERCGKKVYIMKYCDTQYTSRTLAA